MKLFYGEYQYCQGLENFKVYNFCSLRAGLPNQLNLIPSNTLGAVNEYDFDCRYASWILANDATFMSLMNIVMDIYNGINVYIAVSFVTEWETVLTESLLKLLQQRYGLVATYITSIEDIIESNDVDFQMCGYGLYNLDADKERWSFIYENARLMSGGVPNKDE